jgi:hypothetical protein
MGQKWDDLGDVECKRILSMSAEEIRVEFISLGLNPEKVIEEVDRIIAQAKVEAYRRRMKLFV